MREQAEALVKQWLSENIESLEDRIELAMEAAALSQRERCAAICEAGVDMWPGEFHPEWNDACRDRAKAIREQR